MFKRILAPVDGSKIGDQALEHAIKLAALAGANVYAVYVIEYPSALYMSGLFDIGPYQTAMAKDAAMVLDRAKERLQRANVLGEVKMIDSGNAGKSISEELEEAVEALAIDLVIMGTHGRRGFQRLMLGSVAEAFVKRCTVPVMLIPERRPV